MSSSTPWAGLSAAEHEFQYNPQKAFPHFGEHQVARAPANARARAELKAHFDIAYGGHPLHKLDVFPAQRAGRPAPVHVFLHGGYWRAQDKQNFSFVAGTLVPLGITTVVANYELCPAATLDGVVASALGAFEWTCRHVGDYGGDAGNITLSGHSAGAHLAAEIMATDWAARGIDPAVLKGATMISGIFDPAPAKLTTVNQQLLLTDEIAARHDVERRAPLVKCATAIIAGGLEPDQWIDQSYRYFRHVRRHGIDPSLHVLPGHDHFGIITDYLDPDSVIVRTIRAHAG